IFTQNFLIFPISLFFTGKRHAPSVFLLPPPPEEISSSLPTLSLTCLARGFFPESIDVQWQKNPGAASRESQNPKNSPQTF
ncbi:IGHE protein, partial [Setophaga kirtlandii]|nr:IGHE protein [Setophaga kirtlandii]